MNPFPPRVPPRVLRRRLIAAWIGGAWLLKAQPVRAQPLTEEAINAFTEVSALLLGLSFDGAQRQRIRQLLEAYVQRGQRREIAAVQGSVDFLARLRQQEPALRAVALRMSRSATLQNLASEAQSGDELAGWLLAQYHRVHPVLAPGKPGGLPLTRDIVDGQLDLAHFMATEIHRHPAPAPTDTDRERAYRAAAVRHASLSPEAQLAMAEAPGEAARLRYGWQRASPMDRLLGRAELGGRLTPQEQAQVQQFMAGLNTQLQGMAAQQQGLLNSSLAHMRQNSETLMGRGTVWNPATRRWEQQGGIVTEFNGTVRVP